MKRYNKQDVVLLEKIYLKLRPWIRIHPDILKSGICCQKCGSINIEWRGSQINKNNRSVNIFICIS